MIFGNKGIQIKTDNLVLRLPKYHDFESWLDLRTASREFLEVWEPKRSREFFRRSAFNNRVKWAMDSFKKKQAAHFFIFNDAEKFLGSITIDNIRRSPSESGTVGYWLGEAYTKKGYMTEALKEVIQYSFVDLKLSRLEAATLPENTSSRKLLEGAGFKYEGVGQSYLQINSRWRNHILYGLLSSQRRGQVSIEKRNEQK